MPSSPLHTVLPPPTPLPSLPCPPLLTRPQLAYPSLNLPVTPRPLHLPALFFNDLLSPLIRLLRPHEKRRGEERSDSTSSCRLRGPGLQLQKKAHLTTSHQPQTSLFFSTTSILSAPHCLQPSSSLSFPLFALLSFTSTSGAASFSRLLAALIMDTHKPTPACPSPQLHPGASLAPPAQLPPAPASTRRLRC
eukprot:763714-Hanusia_phi.AAC.4